MNKFKVSIVDKIVTVEEREVGLKIMEARKGEVERQIRRLKEIIKQIIIENT